MTQTKKKVTLKVLKSDMGAGWEGCSTCTLSVAAKRQFKTDYALESINQIYVGRQRYNHEPFMERDWFKRMDEAKLLPNMDDVVFSIVLTESELRY